MTRATRLLNLFFVLAATCLITGCEPSPPSKEELGRVVFKESEVPGAEETYTVPERLRSLKTDETEQKGRRPGE
ncbi:MAG TPA: hypothetical protein VG125_07645 [Pirellulales bacterium]|jgi:hypothetical protein|nr:hypothetical protein [Pirellulales bacterium]